MGLLAGGFLGGSLLFVHSLAPRLPVIGSFFVLGIGWGLLVLSLSSMVWVRRCNLESGRHALEGRYTDASIIDESSRWLITLSVWCLIIGMALVTLFVAMNVLTPPSAPSSIVS